MWAPTLWGPQSNLVGPVRAAKGADTDAVMVVLPLEQHAPIFEDVD